MDRLYLVRGAVRLRGSRGVVLVPHTVLSSTMPTGRNPAGVPVVPQSIVGLSFFRCPSSRSVLLPSALPGRGWLVGMTSSHIDESMKRLQVQTTKRA